VADTRPEPRPESDPDAVEALITSTAARFAKGDKARDGKGRWTAGGRSRPDRDVRIYLTRVAYGMTLRQTMACFGMKCRKATMKAVRRGRKLIEGNRGNPKPPIESPKNEPAW
jgi:hypothetical protein